VTTGDRTLRAAIDEALRAWVSDPLETYYLLGSVVGPHPYPYLVRELQSVIGPRSPRAMLAATGALPDAVIACVGGGSNSNGAFHAFIPDTTVEIIGVEAGGRGAGLVTTPRRSPSGGPAYCTAPTPCCCRTRRPDPGDAFGFRRARLIRRRPGARAAVGRGTRSLPDRERRGGAGRGARPERMRRDPAGPRERATPSRARRAGHKRTRPLRARVSLGARDKDMSTLQQTLLERERR